MRGEPIGISASRLPLKSVTIQKKAKRVSHNDELLVKTAISSHKNGFSDQDTKKRSSAGDGRKTKLTCLIESDNNDSDYESASLTPCSHEEEPRPQIQCGLWDWRSTHIGAFHKKRRLLVLKRRLEMLGSVKPLPFFEADVHRPTGSRNPKKSKYNPHEECFVTDVSHRSKRCTMFKKLRHVRLHGQVTDLMLQRVQVPVGGMPTERVSYTLPPSPTTSGSGYVIPAPPAETHLKINRIASPLADFLPSPEDGLFWAELNMELWRTENNIAKHTDENNRQLDEPPEIIIRKADFYHILSALETICYNVLDIPNQTDDIDDAYCEICQSETSDSNDPIVFCEGCGLAVHKTCFGITQVPKAEWYCQVCDSLGNKAVVDCRFCPLRAGTMKRTCDGGWAHHSCSVWHSQLRFTNLETFEAITNEWDLPSESFTKICSVCDCCYGSVISCSVPSCNIPFHPTCGLRGGLFMFFEDHNRSKIGVKLFSFCAYHSEKARSVRKSNARVHCDDFVRSQLNVQNINSAIECYELSQLSKLEKYFDKFVDWIAMADSMNLPHDTMEKIFNYWVGRRRDNNNRPLVNLYEANEVFLSMRFKNSSASPVKKQITGIVDDEELSEMVEEYSRAHMILDKRRNLATQVEKRERRKQRIIQIFTEAMDLIMSTLESDSHLSERFLEKLSAAVHEQIHGLPEFDTTIRDESVVEEAEEPSLKRRRSTNGHQQLSPRSRRTNSFKRPFNKVQEVFACLFDADPDLNESLFALIPENLL